MLNFYKLVFTCLLTFMIAACSFHLRGHEPLPAQLKILCLETDAPYSDFTKQLRLFLKSANVILVDKPQDAPLTLKILREGSSQQLTSAGSSGQTNTYTITYTIIYQLSDKQGHLIQSPQAVFTTRDYSITSNQVLGDTNVQNNLVTQMQRDVIYQMINRLRTPQTLRNLEAKLNTDN